MFLIGVGIVMKRNFWKNKMSKIFTKGELAEIERRKKGDKSDKFGLFSRRVRPKINEILSIDLEELRELINKNVK